MIRKILRNELETIISELENIQKSIEKLKEFKRKIESAQKHIKDASTILDLGQQIIPETLVNPIIESDMSFVGMIYEVLEEYGKPISAPRIYQLISKKYNVNDKTANNVYATIYNYQKRNSRFFKQGKKFGLIKWKDTKQ